MWGNNLHHTNSPLVVTKQGVSKLPHTYAYAQRRPRIVLSNPVCSRIDFLVWHPKDLSQFKHLKEGFKFVSWGLSYLCLKGGLTYISFKLTFFFLFFYWTENEFVPQSLCIGMLTQPESSDWELPPKSIWPSWLVAWVGWKLSWLVAWVGWKLSWLVALVGWKLSRWEVSASWVSAWPAEEVVWKVDLPKTSIPSRHCCTWYVLLHTVGEYILEM